MAPQDLQNCGRDFAKRKQSDAEFAGNRLPRMVIIDRVINTLLGRLTLDPAGMHCPSWDDAFVSSLDIHFGDSTKCGAGRICGADRHWPVVIT